MYRKFLIILTILCLAVLPACAEEQAAPTLSDDVLLLQRANNALIDRYALTIPTLGLFDADLNHCGDAAIVTYTSNGSVDDSLCGEYFVFISGEEVQAYWTHDDIDPALWQSDELTSPAWGVKQLTAYLDMSPYERADFCAPYVQHLSPYNEEAFTAAGGSIEAVGKDNRTEANAARDLAVSSVQLMFGLTDEQAAWLNSSAGMDQLVRYPDGHSEWQLMLLDEDVLDPVAYYVTLDADTKVILKLTISSGGVG